MATIELSIDSDLAQEAERILASYGLSLEEAVTAFLEEVIRCNGMPFALTEEPVDNEEKQAKGSGYNG